MPIANWKRALGLGFLSWLAPFAFSVLAFPLKKANPPLFEGVMVWALCVAAGVLYAAYLSNAAPRLAEAAPLGFLWAAINLVCDYPMFAYGPMKMTAAQYYSGIGVDYAIYPAFLIATAWIAGRQRQAA